MNLPFSWEGDLDSGRYTCFWSSLSLLLLSDGALSSVSIIRLDSGLSSRVVTMLSVLSSVNTRAQSPSWYSYKLVNWYSISSQGGNVMCTALLEKSSGLLSRPIDSIYYSTPTSSSLVDTSKARCHLDNYWALLKIRRAKLRAAAAPPTRNHRNLPCSKQLTNLHFWEKELSMGKLGYYDYFQHQQQYLQIGICRPDSIQIQYIFRMSETEINHLILPCAPYHNKQNIAYNEHIQHWWKQQWSIIT